MARPKKVIDPEQVKKLAMINCSLAEMAAVLGCNESTLQRRFAQVIKEGREQGKSSLKKKQFQVAMSGNVSMLIWLGKITLGQVDTNSQILRMGGTLNLQPTEELESLKKQSAELIERLKSWKLP